MLAKSHFSRHEKRSLYVLITISSFASLYQRNGVLPCFSCLIVYRIQLDIIGPAASIDFHWSHQLHGWVIEYIYCICF